MLRFVPTSSRMQPRAVLMAAEPDSAELQQRIAAGESAALEQAYRLEAAPVYRYAFGLCGNASWAADATQDAFVALASRPQTFDPARGTLGAWLAGVARHALLAQWRRRRNEMAWPTSDDGDGDDGLEAGVFSVKAAATPETLMVRSQSGAAVWAAVQRLPFAQREALILVDLQERPYEEAARIAGIELNTLRTRLHRGRARLAQWLEGIES